MGVPVTAGADRKTRAVDEEIAKHGGDAWAAVRALLDANEQLEIQLEGAWALVSGGYVRRRQPEPPTEH